MMQEHLKAKVLNDKIIINDLFCLKYALILLKKYLTVSRVRRNLQIKPSFLSSLFSMTVLD